MVACSGTGARGVDKHALDTRTMDGFCGSDSARCNPVAAFGDPSAEFKEALVTSVGSGSRFLEPATERSEWRALVDKNGRQYEATLDSTSCHDRASLRRRGHGRLVPTTWLGRVASYRRPQQPAGTKRDDSAAMDQRPHSLTRVVAEDAWLG
jgi:hypothetical protein